MMKTLMMKTPLPLLVAGLALGAGGPPAEPVVKDVEQAVGELNAGFEKGDAAAVRRRMTADHQAVTAYYDGPVGRDAQIDGLKDLKLTEYSPGKLTVTVLGRDAALVRYALAMAGTYKGRPVPARNIASAVWVRRDGRWQEAFYQETPQAPSER
jgi:ketosteroid isomerase-like protein